MVNANKMLYDAIRHNDLRTLEKLIKSGIDLNKISETDEPSPLMLAASLGRADLARVLIQYGADLDIRCLERGHELILAEDSEAVDVPGDKRAVAYIRPLLMSCNSSSGFPIQIRKAPAVSGNEKVIPSEFDWIADECFYSTPPACTAIEMAAFRGHLEVVKVLFDAGALDRDGALFAACLGLQEEVACWLLASGVRPYWNDNGQESPLHALGRFQTEIRLPDSDIEQIATLADRVYLSEIANRQDRMAGYLLSAGAKIGVRDLLGRTELHAASQNLTVLAIVQGTEPGARFQEVQQTNPIRLIRRLLQAGADPNAVDHFGRTPLMLAVTRLPPVFPYHPEVVEALVAAGAKLDACDLFGRNGLMLAVRKGQTEALWQLLQLGADLHQIDHCGRSLLHWAVLSGAHPETLRQLIESGADPMVVDCDGLTALDYARTAGQPPEVIDLFKNLGVTDHWGLVVEFCVRVESGQMDEARELLDDLSDMHRFVWTKSPWLAALESRRLELIEELLFRGADIHAGIYPLRQDYYRDDAASALHWAAFHGASEVARLLLRHGASPQQTDERGRTPVTCAATGRHFELMDELLTAGGPLDPLAKVYAELRDLPGRVESAQFLEAVSSLTIFFGSRVRHMEDHNSVQYWSLTAEEDELIARHRQYNWNGRPSLAERLTQGANMVSLLEFARQKMASFPFLLTATCESRSHDGSHLVALVPSPDQLVAVAAIGTFGNEDELSTERLVEFLLEVQRTAPFEITGMGRDSLALRFIGEIKDPVCLARRLYEICPNVISKEYGTMDRLLAAIRGLRRVLLWWD